MPLPSNPPATTSPPFFKTWSQDTVDSLTDHESRIDDLEAAVSIDDTAYDATTWNGATTTAPSKNAVRDKIEDILDGATFSGDIIVPDDAYDATAWNGNLEVPTKNAVRDKIESLGVGGGSSPTYSTYTPTISQNGARTTSSLTAKYVEIGTHVHVWGEATVSNAGTSGHAISVTLPVAPANIMVVGTGQIFDAGTAIYSCVAYCNTGSTVQFYDPNTVSGNVVGVTPAFALASGDVIRWNFTYEAA